MGLRVKQASSYKLGILSSLLLVAAVLAAPYYGVTPHVVLAQTDTSPSLSSDNSPPQATIIKPIDGNVFNSERDKSVEIRASVTDSNPHHYYYKISGPDFSYEKTVNNLASFTDKPIYTWNLKDRKDGVYTITLEARDAAGNKDEAQSVDTVTVSIDNSAPIINTPVTFFDGPNAENSTINGVKTFHITQEEANPKDMYVELNYKNEEGKWEKHFGVGYGAVNAVDFTVDTSMYSEAAEYQIKISSDDQFEQHAGYAFRFTIDRTAPALPSVSIPGGEYGQSQSINLTTDDPSSFIYYTIDNTPPTSASQVYTGPIDVGRDTIIHAMAIDRAGNASGVMQAAYVIKADSGGETTPPIISPGTTGDKITPLPLVTGLSVSFDTPGRDNFGLGAVGSANSSRFFGNANILDTTQEDASAVEGLRISNDDASLFESQPTAAVVTASTNGWKLLGFAWYWWVLLLVVGVCGWWTLAGLRRRAQAQEF